MGNRAVIVSEKGLKNGGISPNQIGVYLHWNGGRDSVEAFLKYCELKGYRSPDVDNYGWARLCQVIGNFFGGTASIGIDIASRLDCDNWDNGVYVIKGWEIVGRKFFDGRKEQDHYNMFDMLYEIDSAQPKAEQLGKQFWTAEELPIEAIDIGDKVFIGDWNGTYSLEEIVGYNNDFQHTPCYVRNGKQIPITSSLGGSYTDNIFRVLK